MQRKKLFTIVILTLIAIIAVASVVLYVVYAAEKPWIAFFMACGGGLLIVNLLFSLLLVKKNFRE